jgi:hypothetical protein
LIYLNTVLDKEELQVKIVDEKETQESETTWILNELLAVAPLALLKHVDVACRLSDEYFCYVVCDRFSIFLNKCPNCFYLNLKARGKKVKILTSFHWLNISSHFLAISLARN